MAQIPTGIGLSVAAIVKLILSMRNAESFTALMRMSEYKLSFQGFPSQVCLTNWRSGRFPTPVNRAWKCNTSGPFFGAFDCANAMQSHQHTPSAAHAIAIAPACDQPDRGIERNGCPASSLGKFQDRSHARQRKQRNGLDAKLSPPTWHFQQRCPWVSRSKRKCEFGDDK